MFVSHLDLNFINDLNEFFSYVESISVSDTFQKWSGYCLHSDCLIFVLKKQKNQSTLHE